MQKPLSPQRTKQTFLSGFLMIKLLILALFISATFLTACAHPNPRGAMDEMVGTVGGAYRNISTHGPN